MSFYTKQGTPAYHSKSALSGHAAKRSVTRRMTVPAEIERENQMRAFKLGAMLGFVAAAVAFAIFLWGWVIPTMDAAVATAQGMVA